MRPTIAILVLLLATPSFAAMSREDFAREIRRRIDEKICPLTVIRGETGESIAALKEHPSTISPT